MLIKTFESPDGKERVLILRRSDGCYTFRRQWRSTASRSMNVDEQVRGDRIAVDADAEIEHGWGPPGPDCGIYDTTDSAETEAHERVPWLKRQFH